MMMIRWAGHMGIGVGPMGLDLWEFVGVWLVMMAAMMLPSLTVTKCADGAALARGKATAFFALGYLVVWTAIGFICYPASEAFAALVEHHSSAAVAVSVALFIACALYQASELKWLFLERCRPCAIPVTPVTNPYLEGVRCAASCLGASGLAMSLLFPLGFMQLKGMAVIGAALLVERHINRRGICAIFGLAALAYGIAIAVHPSLAPALTANHMGQINMTGPMKTMGSMKMMK
jgi:predicted metal-binding membrane protein